jgi:hypothetical protein
LLFPDLLEEALYLSIPCLIAGDCDAGPTSGGHLIGGPQA